MRIGLLGGTFDPVHYGHLLLAECCREQCRLDQVWFVPAAIPPHKQQAVISPAAARVAMLELALGGHEAFRLEPLEIDRGAVSYTVETLRALQARQPADEFFLLLGADALADLPQWREPAEICRRALPTVVRRPGAPEPDFHWLAHLAAPERIEQMRRHQVEMPQMDLSSRDLRRRVSLGQSIRYRTPRAVEMLILTQGLYQNAAP